MTAYLRPKLLLLVHFRTQNETRIFHRILPGGQLSLKAVQERRGPLQGFQDRGTGDRGMRQRPCPKWACPAAGMSSLQELPQMPALHRGHGLPMHGAYSVSLSLHRLQNNCYQQSRFLGTASWLYFRLVHLLSEKVRLPIPSWIQV